jgi:hypothetical protein
MTAKDSKRLEVDDQVVWGDDPHDVGTVIETGYNAVKISWDNGQTSIHKHWDMALVFAVPQGLDQF